MDLSSENIALASATTLQTPFVPMGNCERETTLEFENMVFAPAHLGHL